MRGMCRALASSLHAHVSRPSLIVRRASCAKPPDRRWESHSVAAARAASHTSASSAGWRSTGFPIDVAAGTSMGGLVGGAYATGMDAGRIADVHHRPELGSALRRVDVRVQEHPAQDRRARVSVAPRVRPQGRHRAADRSQQRPGRRAAPRPHCGAVLRHRRTSTTCRRRFERWPSICCRRSRWSCAAARWPTPCAPRCPCR